MVLIVIDQLPGQVAHESTQSRDYIACWPCSHFLTSIHLLSFLMKMFFIILYNNIMHSVIINSSQPLLFVVSLSIIKQTIKN